MELDLSGLTEKAQKAILAAIELNEPYPHSGSFGDNLLLVLLDQPGSIAAQIITRLGGNPAQLREEVEKALAKNNHPIAYPPKLSDVIEKVLARPKAEAAHLGETLVSSECLLIGRAALYSGGFGSYIMRRMGVTPTAIRKLLVDIRVDPNEQTSEVSQTLLQRYGYDLTQAAHEGKLTHVTGSNEHIERCIQVLARRTFNNPLLIEGSPADKLAIVEAVAQRIASGEVPESLRNKRLIKLEWDRLSAGINSDSELREQIEEIFDELCQFKAEPIFFIEDISDFLASYGSDRSIDQFIKPALARGEIRVLATTTYENYRKYVWSDAALLRRLKPIPDPEAKKPQLVGSVGIV